MASFQSKIDYLKSAINLRFPSLDLSPTSMMRAIMDAFAEMSAQADIATDEVFNWDVSSLSGNDLSEFCSVFGFSRLPAIHATGFITIRFSGATTDEYLIESGTSVWGTRGSGQVINYQVETNIGVPRHTSSVTIPIVAASPGSYYNARPGEIRSIEFTMESMLTVLNEEPVNGGREEESDAELRERFLLNLFRSIAGTEDYYVSIADRHPRVSQVQLIKPVQTAEEYLKIVNGEARAQEDSLKFTFASEFSIYLTDRTDIPESQRWLGESLDYEVIVDNTTPQAPLFRFLEGGNWNEGDLIRVTYGYSSIKSRNEPQANEFGKLDLYIKGRQPAPVIDYSYWPQRNEFGNQIDSLSFPDAREGERFYIFARQPVVSIQPEFDVNGRTYIEGRDYRLVKDKSENEGSTRARDMICWVGALPPRRPDQAGRAGEPGFQIPYFHETVIGDIQEALDAPEIKGATDDILCHSADVITLDFDLTVQWEGGVRDQESIEDALKEHLASVRMGYRVSIGDINRTLSTIPSIKAIFLNHIKTSRRIHGTDTYRYDIPLPDGAVPELGEVTIQTSASNTYEGRPY